MSRLTHLSRVCGHDPLPCTGVSIEDGTTRTVCSDARTHSGVESLRLEITLSWS